VSSHSNVIAGFLLLEFVIYITSRGRLARYKSFLIG
jgi:hypothetical protein